MPDTEPDEVGRKQQSADGRVVPTSTVVPPHVFDDLVATLHTPPVEMPHLAAAARRARLRPRIVGP